MPEKRSGPMGVVSRWIRSRAPERGTLIKDMIAGLPGAISSVPDGMAASVLAGVNPVHGLYASIFGPVAGGLTSSTRLMVITTTSAAALAAGSAIAPFPDDDRPRALFLLTLMAGVLMILAGIARLGRYTRFVPHSVMIGFLSGVGANIVFGQIPDILGASASGPFPLARAWDVITHPGRIDLATTAAGLSALLLLLLLARTRFGPFSSLIALVLPSIVVAVWGAATIPLVSDVGEIPQGLPLPVLPHPSDFSFGVVTGAFSVAALVLIQGAGVSESAPNRDGTRSNPNGDFIAQGLGNLFSGLFRGQPVGGSVGQTAVNVSAGAQGRWAAIFSGLWMAAIIVAFSGLVGSVVMSTLAAVLIYAAIGSFRTGSIVAILRTGRVSQIAVVSTFAATLFLPVAAAVGIGVVLALLMQLNQEAIDLRVVQLVPDAYGRFTERPAPKTLASRQAVLLDVYGSLYYAGARTLQARLPDPAPADRPAVVIRLRGRLALGSTSFVVLSDYASRLAAVGGRLFISGIDPGVLRQLRRNQTVHAAGEVETFEATETIGESSMDAYTAALAWLATLDEKN
jgi:SulP family sulfate permease